jgi:hypothetical protein
MESNGTEKVSYAVINNIPADYHSCDLRNYFSQFIESKGFECFHFRHRPEQKLIPEGVQIDESFETAEKRSTLCCVVRIKQKNLTHFMKLYNRKHWIDSKGEVMSQVCYISKVKSPDDTGKAKFCQTV